MAVAERAVAQAGAATQPLLEVKDLRKYFPAGRGAWVKAIDGVSFEIRRGEVFGLVGESGCGKTTVGRTIVRLYRPTSGSVIYDGIDVHRAPAAQRRALHRRMQMIFQDPYASLNPRMTVGDIIGEALDIHGLAPSRKARAERVQELLQTVGLNKDHVNRFPHEFSGGQRQRIGIARALAVDPEFIVADEPISALDVSVQAQVVNLMRKLQEERGLTYLFIAHDLAMVKYLSDRIGVMYLGRMMEMATSEELHRHPLHPYTQALLSAIPIPDPDVEHSRERIVLQGDVPSPVNPPSGCPFRTRCPIAQQRCAEETPAFREAAPGHFVACHFA
ncbi:MAG: ATP-binding cassette domain-containing protein [Firmicutes bacterium]|nr:ATP-binding cassette domain-containing protein [Bacillota bacterium]